MMSHVSLPLRATLVGTPSVSESGLLAPLTPRQGQKNLSQGALFAPRGQIRLSRTANPL
jgi:hypothetical protein